MTTYTLTALTPEDVINVLHYYRSTDADAMNHILAIAQTCTATPLTKADVGGFVDAILAYHFTEDES